MLIVRHLGTPNLPFPVASIRERGANFRLGKKQKQAYLKLRYALRAGGVTSIMYLLQLTYADILFYGSIQACFYEKVKRGGIPEVLDGFPLLKSLYDRVANNPGIKAWVENRPDTPF